MLEGGKASAMSADGSQPGETAAKTGGGPSRSRTFTGCRTCRSRHLKCDETRPVCSTCKRLGLPCEGYEARLFWVPDRVDKQSHRGNSFRYPLFTEDARNAMSTELVRSLGSTNAHQIILDLDADFPPGFDCLIAGPFGVFRAFDAAPSPSSLPSETQASSLASSPSNPSLNNVHGEADQVEEAPEESRASGANLSLDHLDYLDMLQQEWSNGDNGSLSQLLSISTPRFDLLSPPVSPRVSFNISFGTPEYSHPADTRHEQLVEPLRWASPRQLSIPRKVPSPPAQCSSGFVTSSIPAHAHSLLRYYKEKVLNPSLPSNGKRTSPWQLFLLPCALETFAELTLWNTASATRYSILYSLLSNSAFHLHGSQGASSSQWLEVAVSHQESAKVHLKKALQTQLGFTDQANYSEILMAILAMAMVSVFHDSHAVKIFLLDAERLIRLRGLPNPKSFKTRVLHHMYTHLRLIAESFDVSVDRLTEAQLSDRKSCPSVELGKFRISEDGLGNDFDLTRPKPEEIGYNDIHLEVAGEFPPTLYPEIYGIPESLMTLFSRTISLANEKCKQDVMGGGNGEVLIALPHHIRTLERTIWSWSLQCGVMGPDIPPNRITADNDILLHQPHTRSMVLGLHQALSLYFYRRIHNISAMVLQSSVQKTFEYLEPCLQATIEGQDFATTIAWAGFIAACEAVTTELQERGLKCLAAIDNRGIFFGVEKPGDLARMIWERRARSQDWSLSWPDLIQRTA